MKIHDWLDLLLRWTHLIAGIAWIGSSFYFIWLDRHLTVPPARDPEVEGELWMVHSGGFYQVERRRIGPGHMPPTLHWFKWEAALTWLSGLSLLVLVYYLTHGLFLVDRSVSGIGVGAATALGIGVLVVGWLVYDLLWQSPLGRRNGVATAVSLVLLAGVIYGLCHVLSGRAAYIHVGAMLGTLMAANVWVRILPAQQRMIDATEQGRAADFTEGERAKRRSLHNSYMTFPVLIIMLSNHFPGAYAHRWNWLVLDLLVVVGVGARHAMIGRGRSRTWVGASAAAALLALFALTVRLPSAGAGSRASAVSGPAPSFAQVQAVVIARCLPCHSLHPTDPTFGAAPAGVSFDQPENIRKLAPRIQVRVVETKTMPLGNKTLMTQAERDLIGSWIAHGAPGP